MLTLTKFFYISKKIAFCFLVLIVLILVIRSLYLRPRVALNRMAPAEPFNLPTHIVPFPRDNSRFAVTEKPGTIKWIYKTSRKSEGILLDISQKVYSEGWEEGLLSIAFDPQFEENSFYYVFYSLDNPKKSRISRFTMNPDYTTDLSSELVILEIKKFGDGHNGGMLEFGKDQYLYASIGYGVWFSKEEMEFLQARTTLYGTVIRIDVRDATTDQPYEIPLDNPFIQEPDTPDEIWAYGLRNLWRFSFDRKTGKMYGGDVGEVTYEEINLIKKGGNYGWAKMEGPVCYPPVEVQNCDRSEIEMPIAALDRFISRSVTGGYVYRGKKLPWLEGKYVFGDFLRGMMYISIDNPSEIISYPKILLYKLPIHYGPNKGSTMFFTSFGEDTDGELYVVNLQGGVYQIEEIGFVDAVKGFLYMVGNFR